MMRSTVRVIIVSWNAKADLRACLASLADSSTDMSRVEIVVVDTFRQNHTFDISEIKNSMLLFI